MFVSFLTTITVDLNGNVGYSTIGYSNGVSDLLLKKSFGDKIKYGTYKKVN